MKIYTKAGDKGETAIIGGKILSKSHTKIEAFGDVDELNAHLGLILAFMKGTNTSVLESAQNCLFVIGSMLASEYEKPTHGLSLPLEAVTRIENAIDEMQTLLPTMTHFILPGGSAEVAQIHLARCVCRRAERAIVRLQEMEKVNETILQYLNRLSDYLFVLARYQASQTGVREIKWLGNI